MPDSAREKMAMFSNVDINQVICLPDVNNIYKVPLVLFDHKVAHWLADRLSLTDLKRKLTEVSLITNRNNSLNAEEIYKSFHIMQKWFELHDR